MFKVALCRFIDWACLPYDSERVTFAFTVRKSVFRYNSTRYERRISLFSLLRLSIHFSRLFGPVNSRFPVLKAYGAHLTRILPTTQTRGRCGLRVPRGICILVYGAGTRRYYSSVVRDQPHVFQRTPFAGLKWREQQCAAWLAQTISAEP